jgi:glutathione S-transferase
VTSSPSSWIVWTSALSPFGLKVILSVRHAGLPLRVLPAEGSTGERLRYDWRRRRVMRRRLALTWPRPTNDDEFPLVPYLFGPDGENLYDSTAIAEWLDRLVPPQARVIPEDPAARFVTRLLDDYADEFGLYMVHHNRWKVSAADNDASARLVAEFRPPWPLSVAMRRWWQRRQTRRLPYLFSVAPRGFRLSDMPVDVQPPSLEGFPPTHDFLEDAFARLLAALDALLRERPFVLGDRLTLADAGLYGQLAMNLTDPSAERWMREAAPSMHAWLLHLERGETAPASALAELRLDASLRPLLAEVVRVFVPLMQANHRACEDWKRRGETLFNEAAFDRGRALYDGEVDGTPFRHVAKTFQSKVWSERVREWRALAPEERRTVEALLPSGHGLDDPGVA